MHIPQQSFQYDERVLIVLKCTETNSGLKQPDVSKDQMVSKAAFESEDGADKH